MFTDIPFYDIQLLPNVIKTVSSRKLLGKQKQSMSHYEVEHTPIKP